MPRFTSAEIDRYAAAVSGFGGDGDAGGVRERAVTVR
jgi:hypothetical protein